MRGSRNDGRKCGRAGDGKRVGGREEEEGVEEQSKEGGRNNAGGISPKYVTCIN